jgi:catechol 2,3-dioxygenase
VGQPFGDALDLTLTADDIRALTDARVKADASAMPIAQWSAQLQARIARGGAAP